MRVVGWLGGFGAGALVSAIAYNLVVTGDALSKADLVIWLMVVVIAGIAGALAYVVGTVVPSDTGARISLFAAGGLLAMLTTSLIPFSSERGGLVTGI